MTTEEFLQWVGNQVKVLRKKSGLTQDEIAAKIGSNQSTISLFENQGRGIESVDIIRRIVEATGHTMGDLFDASEKKTHAIPSPAQRLCPS